MVLNKIDVLEKINRWSLKHSGKIKNFDNQDQMCKYIVNNTPFKNNKNNVLFSGNKHNLDMVP